MLLRNSRLGRSQERRVPERPVHVMFSQVSGGFCPIGAIPCAPFVVPPGVVPQNICAGFAEKINVAKIERQPSAPVIGAGSSSVTDPRIRPVDCPAGLGEVLGVREFPQVSVLPIEQLISEFIDSAGKCHEERLRRFNLSAGRQVFLKTGQFEAHAEWRAGFTADLKPPMAKIIPTHGYALRVISIEKNQRQETAVAAGLNPSIGIEGALVGGGVHGFGFEQLAAVIVASTSQIVKLEILCDRT